jgi:hypothetical protein
VSARARGMEIIRLNKLKYCLTQIHILLLAVEALPLFSGHFNAQNDNRTVIWRLQEEKERIFFPCAKLKRVQPKIDRFQESGNGCPIPGPKIRTWGTQSFTRRTCATRQDNHFRSHIEKRKRQATGIPS